jgi:hypothetical protein
MKILPLIMNTIFHLMKMYLPTYEVAKMSVNGKPDSTVIGPAFHLGANLGFTGTEPRGRPCQWCSNTTTIIMMVLRAV